MINIKGIDKAELLVELYDHSHQQGMGMLQPKKTLTIEDARKLLEQTTSFDYLYGKVMKIDLSSDEQFEERLYDRDNGYGMAQSVVDEIRKKMQEAPVDYIEKNEFLEPIQKNDYVSDKPINNIIDTEPSKNIKEENEVPMSNIDTTPKTRTIDLNSTYIGIYDTKEGYRIGLFEKSIRSKSEKTIYINDSMEAQYYEDLLSSDGQVALNLDGTGRDKKCNYTPFTGDPLEVEKWNGVRDSLDFWEVERYGFPPVTGIVDKHINLVQFTSVYPELQGNVSIDKIIICLADFCEKFNFKPQVKAQLAASIKASTNYMYECAQKGESIPTFVNVPTNELDVSNIPADINTIKHM